MLPDFSRLGNFRNLLSVYLPPWKMKTYFSFPSLTIHPHMHTYPSPSFQYSYVIIFNLIAMCLHYQDYGTLFMVKPYSIRLNLLSSTIFGCPGMSLLFSLHLSLNHPKCSGLCVNLLSIVSSFIFLAAFLQSFVPGCNLTGFPLAQLLSIAQVVSQDLSACFHGGSFYPFPGFLLSRNSCILHSW